MIGEVKVTRHTNLKLLSDSVGEFNNETSEKKIAEEWNSKCL